MPSRFGFTTTEEVEENRLQIRKEGMKLANELSPAIVEVLKDLKKSIGINSAISHSLSLKKSGCCVTFGEWSLGNEVQIEIVTLEYDYDSEMRGLRLGVKTNESIGKDNIKQLEKVLSEVTGIKRRWP
jgi:hypothetical protein